MKNEKKKIKYLKSHRTNINKTVQILKLVDSYVFELDKNEIVKRKVRVITCETNSSNLNLE